MSDLPIGVTRYRLGTGSSSKRVLPLFWLIGGVLFAAGLAGAVATGGGALLVAVLVLLGLAVPPAVVVLPGLLRVVVLVALVVGLGLLADWGTEGGLGYAGCFGGSFALGLVVLLLVIERRAWGRRLATAQGAPPSGLDPTGGADVGVLARWRDGKYDYEAVDPAPEVVLGAVAALDGADRSIVSVYRGRGRLDVGGGAGGALVVQQADDRRRWGRGFQVVDSSWRSPATSSEADAVRTTTVVYAGDALEFPERLLVPPASAAVAVRTWLASGQRDASLTWWTPPERRREVRRPKTLREQDRPGSTLNVSGDTSYSY